MPLAHRRRDDERVDRRRMGPLEIGAERVVAVPCRQAALDGERRVALGRAGATARRAPSRSPRRAQERRRRAPRRVARAVSGRAGGPYRAAPGCRASPSAAPARPPGRGRARRGPTALRRDARRFRDPGAPPARAAGMSRRRRDYPTRKFAHPMLSRMNGSSGESLYARSISARPSAVRVVRSTSV